MFESVTTITEMARSKIAMNSFSTIQTEKSGAISKTIQSQVDKVSKNGGRLSVLLSQYFNPIDSVQ